MCGAAGSWGVGMRATSNWSGLSRTFFISASCPWNLSVLRKLGQLITLVETAHWTSPVWPLTGTSRAPVGDRTTGTRVPVSVSRSPVPSSVLCLKKFLRNVAQIEMAKDPQDTLKISVSLRKCQEEKGAQKVHLVGF